MKRFESFYNSDEYCEKNDDVNSINANVNNMDANVNNNHNANKNMANNNSITINSRINFIFNNNFCTYRLSQRLVNN